jgi:hypothetical protein
MSNVIEVMTNQIVRQWGPPSWRNLLINVPWGSV